MEFSFIQSLLSVFNGDIREYGAITDYLKSKYVSAKDQILWKKCNSFINGLYDLRKSISFVGSLFDDNENKTNALRVLEYLERTDSILCVDFMINATRSFAMGNIDTEMYYRIMKAISETLYEDLLFVQSNITINRHYEGNCQILALARSGLMIKAGAYGNATVEEQNHVFTSLGRYVDRYALSLGDDYRQRWYKENENKIAPVLYDTELGERYIAQNEDIEQLFKNNMA